MPDPPVPPTTKIRQSRVKNHTTERLAARRLYLIEDFIADFDDGRTAFGMRMQELRKIEDELEGRSVAIRRRTLRIDPAQRVFHTKASLTGG